MRYWLVISLLLTGQVTFAQLPTDKLSQDPVFKTVLKRHLTYPKEAQRSSIYARVYAQFEVDAKGHLQAISIANHMSRGVRFGLEPTVMAALKKLPSLDFHYAGNYILPVAFVLVDYRQKNKPLVPKDTLDERALIGHTLLQEIQVMGSTVNSKERIRAAARNEAY